MLNVLLIFDKKPPQEILDIFTGAHAEVYSGDEPLPQKIKKNNYTLVLLEGKKELINDIKTADPRVEVFFIGDQEMDAVEAIRLGATACFPAPLDPRVIERLKREVEGVRDLVVIRRETADLERQLAEKYTFSGVVGKNPQMLEIFNFLRRIAPYFKCVTVMGETGSGKEEIAKALHNISPGQNHPFITCNCAALVESLLESELFGHTKGAFTGAVSDKEGIFEAAGEGTVFLDEVGDLPLSFQPHLLRVLQSGDFKRVGSAKPMKAKCRVIAATNRDLAQDAKTGKFREDLYFRLTPLTVKVPPLRERVDDIALLTRHILNKFHKRTGKKIYGFSIQAQSALLTYDWPGNVRELENVIENIAILTNSAFAALEDLPPDVRRKKPQTNPNAMTLEDVQKLHIENVLKQCEGGKTVAAATLGISRRALFRKMEKYAIK
ncbi:MAG: sigma-54-dependent Fis family transcriptional regulator [Deltaproteobacteria bacterium]|nr:sigma-54-dependent Fis family transcriptional regulator [Deltaproteobacteria bacterium]